MADTDVADMKGTEPKDLPEAEKPVAEATGETENLGGEEPTPIAPTAGNEEE